MAYIPYGDGLSTPLVRTDFENEDRWQELLDLAQAEYDDEFSARLCIINDKIFDSWTPDKICKLAANRNHGEIFIVDKYTIQHQDLPVLCIDLRKMSQRFRVIPK